MTDSDAVGPIAKKRKIAQDLAPSAGLKTLFRMHILCIFSALKI